MEAFLRSTVGQHFHTIVIEVANIDVAQDNN